ncbi:hypothetical protein CEUSTIGMA_g2529.t1 [Chlamydomonas eustigma]|uniref:SHSP domain-containing protein n=1 Tax=Chlamydomonas eustigma TaxID=1157962 RepID=A0A250WWB8_9CHLO|nr:hypothetical protein CEUSTIGMA_g2529.t1 [Chlamydomonas eustigma]|eukprot:GAX75085.1 hypothetical protein CEUSTIGMA_g2529.t1 [Chlamydomonas eustigma]
MLLNKTAAMLRSFRHGVVVVSVSPWKNPRQIRLNFKEEKVEEQGGKQDMATKATEKQLTKQEKAVLTRPSSAHPIMRFNDTLSEMQKEMNALMSHFMSDVDMMGPFSNMSRALNLEMMRPMEETLMSMLPAVEVDVGPDAYTLYAMIPGFSKEEVKVLLSPDGVLSIKGEHTEGSVPADKEKTADEVSLKSSHRFSSFQRSFRLPGDASVENISANVKNGVLTVMAPKKEPPVVQHKEVPVS